jgi:Uri superfamily endonuclease
MKHWHVDYLWRQLAVYGAFAFAFGLLAAAATAVAALQRHGLIGAAAIAAAHYLVRCEQVVKRLRAETA